MKTGDIFFWETDQAIGHPRRNKYHVYICAADWRTQSHTFLFISSADYGGDYKILRTDYPFLQREESYISCNGIVSYTDDELQYAKVVHKGKIRDTHLRELREAIASSDTMEQWQINLVCKFLS